jgi:multidrug efflux pump subunit AcrB
MAKDIFPTLGIPAIYVAQPYGGMDPSQMEGYLTYYYEYHFLYIGGIEHVESKSVQGAAIIRLQFHPGTDVAQAMAETVAYVNAARAFMPAGTLPPFITRFDAGSVPVGQLVFSSETRSVGEMQDAALNLVRPLFATLPGVSAPPPFGGSARTIVVSIDPDRLHSYKLSPDDVVEAVTRGNMISPSGNMMMGGNYPMVPLNSIPKNVKDLEAIPIQTARYPTIFVRDVASVTDSADIVTSYALVNGRRTVYIPVTKRSDASTLSVVNLVRANIAKFQAALPSDVKVSYEFDQSSYVSRALSSLITEGTLGAALTGLMILLFLRDWRSALIVIINIPLSLMAALLALHLTGHTINIMSLGGLALAVGILVDEATVDLENIHVHLHRGKTFGRAALDATNETRLPRLLAMLCIVAMFTPALFMTGTARAMFAPLALAVGFSMIASYFLSSTLVPILSVWMLRYQARSIDGETKFLQFQNFYGRLLRKLSRRRTALITVYLLAAALTTILLGGRLGTQIYPQVDTGQLQIRFRAPAGTDIDGTETVFLKALDIIKTAVGPENLSISIGLIGVHGANFPINFVHLWNSGPEEGVLQVQLKAGAGGPPDKLKDTLRREFAAQLPGSRFSFEPADIVSRVMSMGAGTPIEVAVSGQDFSVSRAFAEKIRDKLERIESLRDVQFGQLLDYPTVDIRVDRERAGIIGSTVAQVSKALVPATWSSRFTVLNFWADPNSGVAYQVQVEIPQNRMSSLEDLGNLPIIQHHPRDPEKEKVKGVLLRNLSEIREGTALGEYDRYNMQRVVSVRANISGDDLGRATRLARQAIAELGEPPEGVTMTMRGQVVPMQEMMGGVRHGLFLAAAAIFLLLMANFQSLKLPLVVVSTLPAVLAGVVLALCITHTTLNIQSSMGAIMSLGVAVANAILLVTFAERARLEGSDSAEAAVTGACSRLRPILMTSAAMIAGMLPMALGGGQAAPLGRAVVGGLVAATLGTLLVLPSVFAVAQARASRQSVSLDPNENLA